ncbi:hypothetical protein ASPVEDRAFT_131358 [Aspergillus versicolor CBS 583.65]|uniref:Uncharacterized protein n=1 Tax=Aspergillus versicolor CBS 583.65 TaxID=1036611 RepID=A0A1L9PKX2_ASPVE|nr:uncharacterized protein ASPVEDRAFT_131358 [Aspergillus versicolor CBS 583.65]OJJ02133.1 hypothetical protein ASPVEDRAFT_131358 [Aspergillus versicolor CBS 583.65]
MAIVSTSIEIAAPPTTVREKFLDFPSIPTYSPAGFIRSIEPNDASITGKNLKAGDKLEVTAGYGKWKFSPVVEQNTEELFCWRGSVPGIFTGAHIFRFESVSGSDTAGSGVRTRLVHEERFSGLLAGVMGEGYLGSWLGMREDTRKGFESFNVDFKKWVESST